MLRQDSYLQRPNELGEQDRQMCCFPSSALTNFESFSILGDIRQKIGYEELDEQQRAGKQRWQRKIRPKRNNPIKVNPDCEEGDRASWCDWREVACYHMPRNLMASTPAYAQGSDYLRIGV